jgi:DNA (cytosine-5)-methyltransferase 1
MTRPATTIRSSAPPATTPGARFRSGSMFSGVAGLDLAVAQVLDTEPVWFCDNDPAATTVLAHRFPQVPNLGDITTVDWASVAPVDVLTGGFPCQDLSAAGRRAGLAAGTRSGLWSHMATAIHHLRPRLVVIENVRGLFSACADSRMGRCPRCVGGPGPHRPVLRGLGRVLGDLANLGYDAVWHGLPAADVGAPHERFRVFIAATPNAAAHTPSDGWQQGWPEPAQQWGPDVALGGGAAVADPDRVRSARTGPQRDRWAGPAHRGVSAAPLPGPGTGRAATRTRAGST